MILCVNFNDITVAVDDQFELADLKSFNGFLSKAPLASNTWLPPRVQ